MEFRELLGRSVQVGVDSHISKRANGAQPELPRITLADLAKHDKEGDLWICIRGVAYDMSAWGRQHPGGLLPLLNLAGRDATDAFEAYHPSNVWTMMKRFECAVVTDAVVAPGSALLDGNINALEATPVPAGRAAEPTLKLPATNFGTAGSRRALLAFRELRQRMLRDGLFETDLTFYYKLAIWYTFLFALTLYLVLVRQSATFAAASFAVFLQQMAFLGHDLGHNAVTHNRSLDHKIGLVAGNLLTGIGVAWWKRSHNVHHVVTNSVDCDPDIQHLPLLQVTEKALHFAGRKFFSTYHEKWFVLDDVTMFFVRIQHFLYYPIMCLARWNLYIQSWILLLSKPAEVWRWKWEFMANVGFIVWVAALTSTFDTTGERATFLLLSHALAGISLHVQITMSHFKMETYKGRPYAANDDSDGWLHTQLAGSLDIDCPAWLDWVHGGLQFQVEHHLFPRVPRHNLRHVQGLIKQFCVEHGLTHTCRSFFQANVETITHMASVAKSAQQLSTAESCTKAD